MYRKIRAIALNSKAEGKTAEYLKKVLERDNKTLEKVMRKTGLKKEDVFKQIEPYIHVEVPKEPIIDIETKKEPSRNKETKKEGDK